jgi:3-hydroxyisobutyrate dehydrogenase
MPYHIAQPGKTRIGWIGTGVMGQSMCQHVMKAGYSVTVFNRSADKAQPLVRAGAKMVLTPEQVAKESDIVFAIVGYPKDVREVFLGNTGALNGSRPGTILVDMTTSDPTLAKEIEATAGQHGVGALDAPVSGGDIGAKEARLSIMVGGEQPVFDAVKPLFEVMGKTIVLQGGPGSGQHTKMVNQILIANNMMGVCEALLYAYRAGLDPTTVLTSVGSGAAASAALNVLWPRMIKKDFEPGFYVEHFIKDMGIALAEVERMQLVLPGLALAKQLYQAVMAQGRGRKGTQALLLALASLSGVEVS